MTLTTLIIIFMIIAIPQYCYELVVAPLLRDHLRLKLLDLKHKMEYGNATLRFTDDKAADIILSSIISVVDRLRFINLYTIYKAKKLVVSQPDLNERIKERTLIVNLVVDPELREIRDLLDKYVFRALMINSGVLLCWMSPFLLVAYLRRTLLTQWSYRLKLMVRSFLFAPGGMPAG